MLALVLLCGLLGAAAGGQAPTDETPDLFSTAWPSVSLPHRRVVLSSKITELVKTVEVEEGQRVKEGDVLVRLDARLLKLQLDAAETGADYTARIDLARTRYEYQQREFDRIKTLGKFASEKDRDELETKVAIAQLEVVELQRQEKLAERNLAYHEARLEEEYQIASPIDGVVSNLWVEAGEMVDKAQRIVEVIDTDTVEVRVHLHERNLRYIKEIKAVTVRFPALGEGRFPGKIHFISPAVDSGSGTFLVKILVEAAGTEIKPGLACETSFSKRAAANMWRHRIRAPGQLHHIET